jgi:hypothetical protein
VQETSWVRSMYLYLMCVVSIALVALGAVASVTGLVHTIAPDLGHRDTLDRVGIGLSNIATNVVDLINESQGGGSESFCRDVTDNDEDYRACLEDEAISPDSMNAIQDGIAEVKSELRSQIRNGSIDQLIRGILLIGVGLLLFRIHGQRTELFVHGLLPAKPSTPAAVPEPPAPIPPPPSARTPEA